MNHSAILKSALLLITLTLPMLAACSNKAFEPFDWKEEIQLHDGRKVIAERLDTYGGAREPGQSEPNTKDRTIKFADPSDPKKTYTHKITGSSNYMMLDFHEGKPWLVVYVGPFSTDTRCPIGTYDTYSWNGTQWLQRALKDKPKEFVKPNMAVGYLSDADVTGQPDLRKKSQLLGEASIARLLKERSRRGSSNRTWQFSNDRGDGRTTDCQEYR